MSTAHEIIKTEKSVINGRSWTSVTSKCSLCGHMVFTGIWTDMLYNGRAQMPDHIDQHKPGRALDIVVDWGVSAQCSVCDDGIGDIVQDDEGLICRECRTFWNIDGTGGMLEDK